VKKRRDKGTLFVIEFLATEKCPQEGGNFKTSGARTISTPCVDAKRGAGTRREQERQRTKVKF